MEWVVNRGEALTLAIFVGGLGSAAPAANWVAGPVDRQGSKLYVDSESVRKSNGKVQIWIKMDHSEDKTIRIRESRELWSYDCDERTSATLHYTHYNANGTIAASKSKSDSPFNYTPVVPETFGETAMRVACLIAGDD